MPKIAIIGAGWMGIGCLRILKECGHEIDVFERLDDIGGVWHPTNAYSGLFLHTPVKQIEYFDYPLPAHIDKANRISAKQLFDYIKGYCQAKQLYQHMIFETEITDIEYNSSTRKTTLRYLKNNEVRQAEGYDYVIYTEGCSSKKIPSIPGHEKFQGEIVHSFDAKNEHLKKWIQERKKIAVLGASKSAADIIVNLSSLNYSASWIYKKSYWFARFNIYRNIMQKNLKKGFSFDFYSFLIILGFIIGTKLPSITYWLWRLFHLIDTYGEKHTDFKRFHFSWLSDEELTVLKEFNKKHAIISDIKKITPHHIVLNNNKKIAADVIICCTGSAATPPHINIRRDQKIITLNDAHLIYRGAVVPEIPNLIFTAFCYLGGGTMNGLNHGKWIKKYIEAGFNEDYLTQNAARYNYPFFSLHLLFDATHYIFKQSSHFINQFIKAKEISKLDYLRSLIAVFFSHEGVKPLEFNLPKNYHKEH